MIFEKNRNKRGADRAKRVHQSQTQQQQGHPQTLANSYSRLIATIKFPPTIAEMRESISTVVHSALPDSGDACGEVIISISHYGYYHQEEALASMREPLRLAVKLMGWGDLCMSENGMADRAHFL